MMDYRCTAYHTFNGWGVVTNLGASYSTSLVPVGRQTSACRYTFLFLVSSVAFLICLTAMLF